MGGEGRKLGGGGTTDESHDGGVAVVGVGAVGGGIDGQRFVDGGSLQFAEGNGGEEAGAVFRVGEELDESRGDGGSLEFRKDLGGLGAEFGIGILQARKEGCRFECRSSAAELAEAPEGVEAGEEWLALVEINGLERLNFLAADEFELRLHADPLVGAGQVFGDFLDTRFGPVSGDEVVDVFAVFAGGLGGVVEFPDAALFVEFVSFGGPVGDVEGSLGAEAEADHEEARGDLVFTGHFEGGTVLFGFEGEESPGGEAAHEEVIGIEIVDGGARIEGESSRAVLVALKGRGDVGGLVGVGGDGEAFIYPGAPILAAVLPVVAPAVVGAFGDVDEAFFLSLHVAVVVDAEEVAELVKGGLLDIAQAGGEEFEVRAIEFAANDGAGEGVGEDLAFLGGEVEALVGCRGVDAPVRSDDGAAEIMSGVGEANGEPVGEGFAGVGDPVSVGVLEFEEIGLHGGVDCVVPGGDAGGDAGDFGVEAFREGGGSVGESIGVGVFDHDDAVGEDGEIFPVDGAVFVLVADFLVTGGVLRGEFTFEPGSLLFDGGEFEVLCDPVPELADVEVGGFASDDRSRIDSALFVDTDGDSVPEERLLGEEAEFRAVGGLDWFAGVEGRCGESGCC